MIYFILYFALKCYFIVFYCILYYIVKYLLDVVENILYLHQ